MPFTIVQTLENGKKVLSCVPEGWVKDDCLAWPRKKADKLTRLENSVPGVDWFLMPCKIKRTGLSYNEGQLAITIMTEITDTDDETFMIKEEGIVKSHNDILERCLEKAAKESITKQPETEPPTIVVDTDTTIHNVPLSSEAPSSLIQTEKETYMELTENVFSDQPLEYFLMPSQENIATSSKNSDCLTEKLDRLNVSVNNIDRNVKVSQETQHQLLMRVISLQTQFEEFMKRTQSENLTREIGFNPINSLDALHELEDTLRDDRSTAELIKKFSLVCGTDKGKGLNNCFILVDVIFDRNFLTTCSWAGGARGEEKKICFKSFERVIKLFFTLIVKSDSNFTRKECEDFFKNILRNSKRRNTAKMVRTSATKTRVKKNKKAPEVQSEPGCQKDAAEPKPSLGQNAPAPEPGESRNAAAPEPGESRNAASPEPGENQNILPEETTQN